MTGTTGPAFDPATQAVCRVLCSDAVRETAAETVASGSLAAFESWVRSTLASYGLAQQLDETDYAALMRLMSA